MKAIIAIILLSVGSVSAIANLTTELSIETDMVDVSLRPGESRDYSIWVSNNLKQNLSANISVIGRSSSFVEMYLGNSTAPMKDGLLLQSEGVEHIRTKVYSSKTDDTGTYSGYVVVNTKNRTYGVPIVVKLIAEKEALMDVKVEPLSKEIMSGEPVKFYVSAYNLGSNEKTGLSFVYMVKNSQTGTVLFKKEENTTIETSLFFVKTFQPEELKLDTGKYTLDTDVLYDAKSVSASCSFEVKNLVLTYATKILGGAAVILLFVVAGFVIKRKVEIKRKRPLR